jgi:hypothetical protein
MSILRNIFCVAAITLLWLLSGPAVATVEVLEAQGELLFWVLPSGYRSPLWIGGWIHQTEEGTTFDLLYDSYNGGGWAGADSSWAGQCSSDGFVYSGDILFTSPINNESRFGFGIECQITVLLEVTSSPAPLTAARTVEGFFPPSAHTVTLTLPDGTSDILLGPDHDTDSAERMLGLGLNRVTFSISYDSQFWSIPLSYSGFVEVNWGGAVGQDARTWGEIKCLYR